MMEIDCEDLSEVEEEGSSSSSEEFEWGGTKLRKSCDFCAKAKRKCDGKIPCSQCSKRDRECHFSCRKKSGPKKPLPRALRRSGSGSSAASFVLSATAAMTSPSPGAAGPRPPRRASSFRVVKGSASPRAPACGAAGDAWAPGRLARRRMSTAPSPDSSGSSVEDFENCRRRTPPAAAVASGEAPLTRRSSGIVTRTASARLLALRGRRRSDRGAGDSPEPPSPCLRSTFSVPNGLGGGGGVGSAFAFAVVDGGGLKFPDSGCRNGYGGAPSTTEEPLSPWDWAVSPFSATDNARVDAGRRKFDPVLHWPVETVATREDAAAPANAAAAAAAVATAAAAAAEGTAAETAGATAAQPAKRPPRHPRISSPAAATLPIPTAPAAHAEAATAAAVPTNSAPIDNGDLSQFGLFIDGMETLSCGESANRSEPGTSSGGSGGDGSGSGGGNDSCKGSGASAAGAAHLAPFGARGWVDAARESIGRSFFLGELGGPTSPLAASSAAAAAMAVTAGAAAASTMPTTAGTAVAFGEAVDVLEHDENYLHSWALSPSHGDGIGGVAGHLIGGGSGGVGGGGGITDTVDLCAWLGGGEDIKLSVF